MINDETRRKLREMNFGEAVAGLEAQQSDPATVSLPFDERIQRLVDYIYQEKYNNRIQRLIKAARLRFPQADSKVSFMTGGDLTGTSWENFSSASISAIAKVSYSRALRDQAKPISPVH